MSDKDFKVEASFKKTPTTKQLLASPFSQRKLKRELEICETARLVLSMCRYRKAQEHLCYVKPSHGHSIWGARRLASSFIVVQLASPILWKEQVYSRGLSSASGYFVFEVVKELPDGSFVVIAAKQARGCALTLSYAVAQRESGRWLLSWEGLPREFNIPLPTPQRRSSPDYYRQAEWRRMAEDLGL